MYWKKGDSAFSPCERKKKTRSDGAGHMFMLRVW
jgi:hypothetical protein